MGERNEGQAGRGGPPRSGWRRRLGWSVVVAAWLYLLLMIGLWILLGSADVWWPATFLMFSPRWLLTLPAAVLLAAALVGRRARGVCGVALVLAAGPVAGFRVPWGALVSREPAGVPLRVLTCNMHYWSKDATALDRFVDETRPDVVAIQEWPGWEHSRALAGPDWQVERMPSLFLASRFPIRRTTRLGADSMQERATSARYELETPAGVVTFFSLHLATPRWALSEVVHDRPGGTEELDALSALRREQSEFLAGEADEVSGPVLLAGDFNTPPESVLFPSVWGRYQDAFTAAGWGWGYTFRANRTAVRIDHVLAGPGWRVRRCRVGPNVGSPHRPVVADLVWVGGAPGR